MAVERDRDDPLARPRWPELLIVVGPQRQREELVLAVLAGFGGLLGVIFGASVLVWASAPPPLLRPAEGVALLGRVVVAVPAAALLGGRIALQLGEQLLRWARRSAPARLPAQRARHSPRERRRRP